MASEQFSLCWDNFHKNMSSGMNALLENEDLVDVTLAVQGRCLKAHKMVLSVCSPYFKELFKSNPCQHPIVFMKDVSYEALSDLLQFMYQGEVQVSQENLTTFIKTAEALQIKGLTGDGNGTTETETTEIDKPHHTDEYRPTTTTTTRLKKQASTPIANVPLAKRSRLSVSSTESQPVAPSTTTSHVSKIEPGAATSSSGGGDPLNFKVEPYEQSSSHSLAEDGGGEDTFGDEGLDDGTEDAEDYSTMDHVGSGGTGEPQAGTSADGTGEGQGVKRKKSHNQRKGDPNKTESRSDYCIECLDYYYTTKSKRDWIQCVRCQCWMHDNCTMYGYFCNACGRLNRRGLVKKSKNKV